VWGCFIELQARLGGDARIGTRLFRLLTDAGFREIELDLAPEVHWAGSPRYLGWIENIAGNVRSARAELARAGLCSAEEIDRALEELLALRERRDASTCFAWNRARGRK